MNLTKYIGKLLIGLCVLVFAYFSTFCFVLSASEWTFKSNITKFVSLKEHPSNQIILGPTDINQDTIKKLMQVNSWASPIDIIWFENENEKNLGTFNPSILPLPFSGGFRYLVAGRFRPDPVYVPQLNETLMKSKMALCLMSLIVTPSKQYLKCDTEPKFLDYEIPYDLLAKKVLARGYDFHFSKFLGIEDPRIVWNEQGMPLMLYGMNSWTQKRHRTVWITDLRHEFPPVYQIWPSKCMISKKEPIYKNMEFGINSPDEDGLFNILEKNYAAMTNGTDFMLQASIEPRKIFKPSVKNNQVDMLLLKGYDNRKFLECFDRLYDNIRFRPDHEIHQATNMLRVTTCLLGQCQPNELNTYYFQIFQVKDYQAYRYYRYVILWHSSGPSYSFHSMLGPLQVPGLSKDQFHFVVSFQYIPDERHENSCGLNMDHGYLDSKLVISVGSEDTKSFAYITTPASLLSAQNMC